MGSDQWSRSWPSSTVSPRPPLHVPAAPHTLLAVFVPAVPEFRALVGDEAAEELRCSVGDAVQTRLVLKKCFTRMMNCEKKLFVDQLNMLVKRVTEEGEQSRLQLTPRREHLGHADVCAVGTGPSGAIRRLLSGLRL